MSRSAAALSCGCIAPLNLDANALKRLRFETGALLKLQILNIRLVCTIFDRG